MKTVGIAEFKANIKKNIDIAQGEKLILNSNKGKSYLIVPVEEVEDEPYNLEFVAKILKGREDIKNGLGVKIATEDLWK